MMENQDLKNNLAQRMQLLEQARKSPLSPGIYFMKDLKEEVLYVGKAKHLRQRLVTYFQSKQHEIPRIEMMLRRVHSFQVMVTATESEALILEAQWIRQCRPRFNIRLKDDKAYPYLRIQIQVKFPRLEWTRRVLQDQARYFGPFPSAMAARHVLKLLLEQFQLRDCSDNVFQHRSRPCLLYQMGRCLAPCVGYVTQEQYQAVIQQVIQVLEGQSKDLIEQLKHQMDASAECQEYERAARYRDQWQALRLVTETQGIVNPGSEVNREVLALAQDGIGTQVAVLKIRHGRWSSIQYYDVKNTETSMSVPEILLYVLTQYCLEFVESKSEGVSNILVSQWPKETKLIEKTLGLKIQIPSNPQEKQLIFIAEQNALFALQQRRNRDPQHGFSSLEEVQSLLSLQRFPDRIECYDISNTQGQDAVASRVVFMQGAPETSLYRRYRIKTVQGANDYAMMKEVLWRRFSNTKEGLPDLVIVDGGRGQLTQACEVLEALAIQGIDVVGLAKARVQSNFQSSNVLTSAERIILPHQVEPIELSPHHASFRLLTHIRDEAHRFALSYHRLLRSKSSLRISKKS